METLQPLLLPSMCSHVRSICPRSQWLTRTPTPKPAVYARVLAHPTPTGPTQQRRAPYQNSMLHCWTDTDTLWVVILPLLLYIISAVVVLPFCVPPFSPSPSFFCFSLPFHFFFLVSARFLTFCTCMPHVTTSSSDCPTAFIRVCL